MIPIRLKLRDFLSYADPDPIDFTGFDVACLSGENGAGKSALLDSITWAVFGAARGAEGGQNQDRLIRDGADEALVDFEFRLQDASYRVVRRRTRAGKGEVRFLVGADGDWRNIAGETLRETESRIAETLRMDYKTFTASAFFVQNRAEDFLARMRPEERKEVFARLLDLGVYEQLEDAARIKAREAAVRRTEHARRAEELAERSEDVESAEAALATSARCVQQANEKLDSAMAEVEKHRANVNALEKAEARIAAERAAVETLTRSVEQLRRTKDERLRDIAGIDEILARSDEVRAAQEERRRLADEEKGCREAQERATKLDAERTAILEQIEGERRLIEARLQERRIQTEAAAQRLRELAQWERKRARIDAVIAGSDDPRDAIDHIRRAGEEQRNAEARLGEELRTLDATLSDLKGRTSMLRRGEGECPVCGSALDAEHRRKVELLIRSQTATASARKQAARAERDTARKEAARCGEELRRLERTLAERDSLLAEREAILARLEPAPVVSSELADLEAGAEADAQTLASQTFAVELRERAASLAAQIDGLYDAGAHDVLRARLDELAAVYGPLAGKLEEAGTRRSAVREELEETTQRLEDAERVLAERRTALEEAAAVLEGLDDARQQLKDAEHNVTSTRRSAAAAETELARLTDRLEAAKRAAADRRAAADAERAAATDHRRYTRLAEAFGRGGIPDLIIDNARPDLEQEANEILGRLTDWEMSVHFAMQRGTKSGKAKETFDVLVHHDGGLRDFAMFSGGEAFRIAFAVRLALSKLLVRRAGARLETLVIDEGFGSQDPAGRERLIEAIDIARGEFAKVLVITHLEDLKDAFGTQIRVTKDPGRGSVVHIVPG